MASLLERLAANESAARRRLAELREQMAALEERLSELAVARKVIEPLLAEECAVQEAIRPQSSQGHRPDPPRPARGNRAGHSRSA